MRSRKRGTMTDFSSTDKLSQILTDALKRTPTLVELRTGINIILNKTISPADANLSAFLGILQVRGLDEESILSLVDAILQFEDYTPFEYDVSGVNNVVCVAGSGKKYLKTLNITTLATLIASGLGTTIVKPTSHGVTSVRGSGDLLSALGIKTCSRIDEAEQMLHLTGVAYFSIENMIPDFDARYGGRQLTISPLSYLLPALMSPVRCDHVFYGLSDGAIEKSASLISRYCQKGNIAVVSSSLHGGFIDELLFNGTGQMLIKNGRSKKIVPDWFSESEQGIIDEIRARTAEKSYWKQVDNVIDGREDNAYVRTICLNAAAIMVTGEAVSSLHQAYEQAHDYVLSHQLRERIQSIRNFQMTI